MIQKFNIRERFLNENERSFLFQLFHFAGYITTPQAIELMEKSRQSVDSMIHSLIDRGFIKITRPWGDDPRIPNVIKVTGSTCRLFSNPNAYIRKPHTPDYILWRLLMMQFYIKNLYQDENKTKENFIATNDDKINSFLEAGLKLEEMPMKYNKDDAKVHFEELIFFRDDLICIVYVDKPKSYLDGQLKTFFKRFMNLITSDSVKERIRILFWCFDETRGNMYRNRLKTIEMPVKFAVAHNTDKII